MMKIIFNNRGVALIVVILMVSVIIALTVEFNRSTRDGLYGTANLSDGIRLYYIAKSGFYGGEALLTEDQNNFDALTETLGEDGTPLRAVGGLFPARLFSGHD